MKIYEANQEMVHKHEQARQKEVARREEQGAKRDEIERYNRQIAQEYSEKKEKDMAVLRADIQQQI